MGSADDPTVVEDGASLELETGITVAGEGLILNGQGVANSGALHNISGNNTWAGFFGLASDSRIESSAGLLTLSSGIVGSRSLLVGGAGNTAIVNIAIGTGALTKQGLGTLTLTGANNTYTGTTTINNGTLLAGSNFTLSDDSHHFVNTNGTLELDGAFVGQRIASISGDGSVNLNDQFLFVGNDNTSFSFEGVISGVDGFLVKQGAGNFTLNNNNTYTGSTRVEDGTLTMGVNSAVDPATEAVLNREDGLGNVLLDLNGTLNPVGVLGVGANFGWLDGQLALDLDAGDIINVATAFTNGGFGGSVILENPENLTLTTYTLVTFGTTDFVASDFDAIINNPNVQLQTEFVVTSLINGEVQLTILGATASGAILQNSNPVNIPTFADFLVSGPVTTGTPAESNTIESLTFLDGSSLLVFNNLTVTSGGFNVPTGSEAINGGNVIVPGDFNLNGEGTLVAGSNFAIAGDAAVDGGALIVNGLFDVGGDINVDGSLAINGLADIGGDLNAGASAVTVSGELFVGGSANLNGGTQFLVASGGLADISGNLNANASTVTVDGVLGVGGNANLNNGSNLRVNSGGVMDVLGATNINFGSSAVINGELYSPEVNVNAGGLLQGNGLIVGDVLNDGIVAPGTSPGVLTIDGNYTQTGNGTLEIEGGDFLSISGNAALAGTLAYTGGGLKYGQQVAFLEAGSISGEFDEILMPNPSKNRGRFLVEGGTGLLLIAPTSYTLVAKTDNQRNVAKALDSFIPQRGNDQETVSIALDLQTEEQYPFAFDQIAPSFYESLADITIDQINSQNQNLAQRASALRLGVRGFQAIGIEAPLAHDRDGKSVMDAKDGKDILSPAPDNKWGVWVQGNGVFARATNASQVPNYNFESGGFLAGADYRWSENFVTGLYAGYQGTYAKYDNGGRTTINSVQFGGYASYDNGGFYTDAIVGGGYSAYAVRRPIKFSTVDRTATSRPDGGQLTTYLGFGYDWEVGNFTIGPILSGQYTYAGITPFEENGAGALNLNVGQQNANSLRTSLGGRIAYTWKLTDIITLIPEGRMFWQHEFLENPRNIGATLDGGNGQSFGYTTSTPDRDAVFAGAGIIGQFGPNWNAYFYYNADFGRQDFVSHAISTGLNFKF